MAYRLNFSDYDPPAAPPAPPIAPPTGGSIPGGPAFIGFPQPPDVPCDPTGDGWRGPPGPPGPPMGSLVSDTAPPNPVQGQLWFDSSNPQLYLWYTDPTSAQWVIATAYAGGLTTDAPSDGHIYGRQNGAWTDVSTTGVPYLPLVGGTVSGPTTFQAGLELTGGALTTLLGGHLRDPASVPTARWMVDFQQVTTAAGGLIRGTNFSVGGAGNVRIGFGALKPDPTGLIIDTDGHQAASATVATPGSGYVVGYITDVPGNIWHIDTIDVNGGVTAVTLNKAILTSTTLTPLSLVAPDWSPDASGCTLNVTYASGTTLSVQPSGGSTVFGGPVTLPGQIAVPAGGSIQAAHDALPATGGSILLAANTTYVVTATVVIGKPNVRISAPSWGTTVQRAASFAGACVIQVTGAKGTVEGFTIDGNSVAGATDFDLRIDGANGIVRGMQLINSAGIGFLGLRGANTRATGNTITGLGVDLGTQRGYGIWALTGATVTIDHNTISGTGIDGIGVDGNGSLVIGNRVFNCHCYVAGPGGQIAIYPLDGSQGFGNGVAVIGNTIGTGGATGAFGIEIDGPNVLVADNTIDTMRSYGIVVQGQGATIVGNMIRNSPTDFGGDGIYVMANNNGGFTITGNRIFDDRATPIMRDGIYVDAGARDNYTVVGNTITGSTSATPVVDLGTGTNKTVAHNTGSAAVVSGPTTFSATGTALTVSNNASVGNALLVGPATTDPTFRFDVNARTANARFQVTNSGTQTGVQISAFTGTSPAAVPSSVLDLIGAGTSAIRMTMTTTGQGSLTFRSAGGTMGSPAAMPSIQIMGAVQASGYTTAWPTSAISSAINFVSGGLFSATSTPAFIQFMTTAISSTTNQEAMRISPNGNLLLGTPTDGAIKLDVVGAARFNGNLGFNNTAPIAKPTVSGAKGSNAALASLLTALVAYGLVTDTTTA